jgi:TetR/AcrR family transcriptional regulator, fatty acid metabolism regulator protein
VIEMDLNPNKRMIIEAAEKLFATKGFVETNISDISSTVGVSDSTIYEHFKNKEDILFAIPQKETQELIDRNNRHLRGIVGSDVKLRKLIWNYLEFLLESRDYSTLVLFALRPNRDFYKNENYGLLKEFTKIYKSIIVEGQAEGKFLPDISPTLFIKLIMGIVDHLLLTYYIENKPEDPMSLFDDMMDLLMNAIACKNHKSEIRDKRIKILNAATDIFSKIGYQKARIQDIARLAGIGDATIYKYFKGKEEILYSLPISHTNALIESHQAHLRGITEISEKIRLLIQHYLHFMTNHPNYASVCVFELRYNKDFYKTEGYQLFKQFARFFYDAINEGMSTGVFRNTINPYVAVKMIFGVIDHIIITWIVFGRPQSPILYSDDISKLVLNAFTP